MRVLVACEFSGVVRDAFAAYGHDATSCDILTSERPGKHIRADVRTILDDGWDLVIAHPPCTYLCSSGARWWSTREGEQRAAIDFFMEFTRHGIPHLAIENPVGIISTRWRKPDQIIQPWMFGHGETKATCLWLIGLPVLRPTLIVEGRKMRVHRMGPSRDRWRERSRTLDGVAQAMARQWTLVPGLRRRREDR